MSVTPRRPLTRTARVAIALEVFLAIGALSIITRAPSNQIERVNSSLAMPLAQSPRHNQCKGRGPWTTAQ
jgi:hypothetical protein